MKSPVVFDFETQPIEGWPKYPPAPVGVSILLPKDRKPKYYAFGHPTENNCTEQMAKNALAEAYALALKTKCGLLAHNFKFDACVAQVHWGLKLPEWPGLHDSMFLIFLSDPHSQTLALKPAAERILGLPPDEQDAVRDWCVANKLMAKNAKEFGHLICQAPGALVGKYANGDTLRTLKLFLKLYPEILARGMAAAYDRERRLLPVLLRNETQGVPVDLKLMRQDDAKYEAAQVLIDSWVRKQLKVGADFNIDSDDQLADAMVASKKADPDMFLLTATGRRSVAKDSMIGAVTDKKFLQAMQYRSRLATAYGTFLHPWCEEAKACGGVVHPSWNQVRQTGFGGDAGARTGRLSASRFMNVPKEFRQRETGKNAYKHPAHIAGLPELPFMRNYMKPFAGEVWCKRDFSAQELRVLAHFGDGVLMERFREDPKLDVHTLAATLINAQFGIPVTRDDTKTIGFGLLYGMGLGSLAERLGVDVGEAKVIRDAYFAIFPELPSLQKALKEYSVAAQPLTTWGGRQYYCEPPKFVASRGRVCTFEYKLLNVLIQGSSADMSKEAMIRYDGLRQHGRLMLFVHDELNISVPKAHVKTEMALLNEAMSSIEADVLMLSEGSIGANWGNLKKFEEPPLELLPWQ